MRRSLPELVQLHPRIFCDSNSRDIVSKDTARLSSFAIHTQRLSDQSKDDILTAAQLVVKGLSKCATLIPQATVLNTVMSGLEILLEKSSVRY